jgi:AraC-like DNA-binding protein/quercetin dioxygenase-like cupin family protein
MVKTGQSKGARRLSYRTDTHGVSLEVITFAQLRKMPAGGAMPQIQRADFHVLASIDSGRGRVTVDFVEYRPAAGDVVWIRPGRVHCWNEVDGLDGTLVLFRPEFVSSTSRAADVHGPVSWRPNSTRDLIRLAVHHLRREHDAARVNPIAGQEVILRALLEVLLLRVADGGASRQPERRQVFLAYAQAVETHHATSRQVTWYANRLGYSERTLSRATLDATNRTAKQFIDDRVILEAKRLLAHGNVSVAECARRTGFDDPANFSKFFRTHAGLAPGKFALKPI